MTNSVLTGDKTTDLSNQRFYLLNVSAAIGDTSILRLHSGGGGVALCLKQVQKSVCNLPSESSTMKYLQTSDVLVHVRTVIQFASPADGIGFATLSHSKLVDEAISS